MRNILKYHRGSLTWGLIIAALLFIPAGGMERFSLAYFDKVVHASLFAVFSYQLITGFVKQFRFSTRRHLASRYGLSLAAAFGVWTEIIQYFIRFRNFEWMDIAADTGGALLGFCYFEIWIAKCLKTDYNPGT